MVTNCNQLKLRSPKDGKRYLTDVATTEQVLRIIQSIPSKKAEPFKMWLAQVGRERIEQQTGKSVITSQNAAQLNTVVTNLIEGSDEITGTDKGKDEGK